MAPVLADHATTAAAPNLNLTPDEKRVYGDLFKQADPENLRVVTGDAALSFFDKTRLDSRVLGEVGALPPVRAGPFPVVPTDHRQL